MPKDRKRKKWFWSKRIGLVFAGLLLLILALIAAGVLLAPDYSKIKTPAGFAVNQIRYLRLDARSQVFISAWLPLELETRPEDPYPDQDRTLCRSARKRLAEQSDAGVFRRPG